MNTSQIRLKETDILEAKKTNAYHVPEEHERLRFIANLPLWVRNYFEHQGILLGMANPTNEVGDKLIVYSVSGEQQWEVKLKVIGKKERECSGWNKGCLVKLKLENPENCICYGKGTITELECEEI